MNKTTRKRNVWRIQAQTLILNYKLRTTWTDESPTDEEQHEGTVMQKWVTEEKIVFSFSYFPEKNLNFSRNTFILKNPVYSYHAFLVFATVVGVTLYTLYLDPGCRLNVNYFYVRFCKKYPLLAIVFRESFYFILGPFKVE